MHSETDDVVSVKNSRSFAIRDGHEWRLLVAVEDNAEKSNDSGSDSSNQDDPDNPDNSDDTPDPSNPGGTPDPSNPGSTPDPSNPGGTPDPSNPGGTPDPSNPGGTPDPSNPDDPTDPGNPSNPGDPDNTDDPSDPVDTQPIPKDPVVTEETVTLSSENGDFQWRCEQDYENTELSEYTFRLELDGTKWVYEGSDLPTITVTYPKEVVVAEVSTEAELADAFAAGVAEITLKNDIALTAPLLLPATANITVNGQGYSLLRGAADDGSAFLGPMIRMDGEGYTRDKYGVLKLKNITVNGEIEGDKAAGAPAIMNSGSLTLDENAVIKNNRNEGTYPSEGQEGVEKIDDYGGGIQVYGYGRLTVTQKALVTGNFADELGGGVYLGNNTIMYLYADVITGNSVPSEEDGGHGADIYAAPGSTIYYDPSIDITREGFYTCKGAQWIPMRDPGADMPAPPAAKDKEVYINVSEGSGYSEAEVLQLRNALMELGYTVISNRIYIDPTNLEDWYVYDHYDPAAWTALGENWEDVYGTDNPKRKKYLYQEKYYNGSNIVYDGIVEDPAYTIEDWIQKRDKYGGNTPGRLKLAQFKEHIYSRRVDGYPAMTLVGYGHPAFVDFLFYDPESDGEKVVNFDVDSSQVFTHTLTGSGFLVNTKVEDNKLYGYLVYYQFPDTTGYAYAQAQSVSIYRLDGIDCDSLHGGSYDFKTEQGIAALGKPLATYTLSSGEWQNEMSIQVKASPKKIEVRQQPKDATTSIDSITPVLSCELSGEGAGNAYGPLVAYTSVGHSCSMASAFTYSNLQMYYTDGSPSGGEEDVDMLSPLEKADFTQNGTQKYFVNLFGTENRQYGDSANKGQYQEYLGMMQTEGIALITDRKTPFADYLGQPGETDSNLYEFEQGEGKLSVEQLVQNIKGVIDAKNGEDGPKSTSLQEKLSQTEGDGGLKKAETDHSVGNIWLKSISDGSQFRELYDIYMGEEGLAVQIMDDITNYYYGADVTVTYEIAKPRKAGYTELATVAPGELCSFVVGKDKSEWPFGQYTVRQRISNGSVYGYAYFNLLERPTVVDPPVVDPPQPSAPQPPSGSSSEPSGHSESAAPAVEVEYIEETLEIAAAEEPAAVPVVRQEEKPKERKPGEPKTGDMPIPALPVSLGACTAFMVKLRLWLYELEMGISEEKKNEMLRALVSWAKDTTMLKVYLAIAATAVVLTVYHLLKAADAKRKQVVALFER